MLHNTFLYNLKHLDSNEWAPRVFWYTWYYQRVRSFFRRGFTWTRQTGFEDDLRSRGWTKRRAFRLEQRLVWRRSFITRVSLRDPDAQATFCSTRKILIFIPRELFLRACLICHAQYKPKKERNQSRSSSQEHEPNHFLFAPAHSFRSGAATESTCVRLFLLAFPQPRWIRFPSSDNCYYRLRRARARELN